MRQQRNLRSPFAGVATALILAAAAACTNSPTAPSSYAPYSQTDLRVGGGTEAVAGSVVAVHYTGWLYDSSQPSQKGAQFDTSRGSAPFEFTVGAGQVIPGWDLGVPGMKVGGLRRLVIPPSLGYGWSRYGPVPPNATLIFEIELLSVE